MQTTLAPLHRGVPAQWPRTGRNLFFWPPYRDCQSPSYTKQNKTNRSLASPDGTSQVLTFNQPVLTFTYHSLIH